MQLLSSVLLAALLAFCMSKFIGLLDKFDSRVLGFVAIIGISCAIMFTAKIGFNFIINTIDEVFALMSGTEYIGTNIFLWELPMAIFSLILSGSSFLLDKTNLFSNKN